ncbi:hypothetical protein TNCV_2017051 [Trichonephila clavipes]|nr:hypothetical protein TNCV_2017051 [Trichonephila clavipes]
MGVDAWSARASRVQAPVTASPRCWRETLPVCYFWRREWGPRGKGGRETRVSHAEDNLYHRFASGRCACVWDGSPKVIYEVHSRRGRERKLLFGDAAKCLYKRSESI